MQTEQEMTEEMARPFEPAAPRLGHVHPAWFWDLRSPHLGSEAFGGAHRHLGQAARVAKMPGFSPVSTCPPVTRRRPHQTAGCQDGVHSGSAWNSSATLARTRGVVLPLGPEIWRAVVVKQGLAKSSRGRHRETLGSTPAPIAQKRLAPAGPATTRNAGRSGGGVTASGAAGVKERGTGRRSRARPSEASSMPVQNRQASNNTHKNKSKDSYVHSAYNFRVTPTPYYVILYRNTTDWARAG